MNNFSYSEIPSFLGSLKNLKYLDLGFAEFSGKVPHELSNLSNLQYLDLRWNYLTIENPIVVSSLSCLKHLDLSGLKLSNQDDCQNNFSSPIPRWLFNISSIQQFDLSSSAFQGSIPREIGNFNFLTILDLSENELDGGLPASIGKLTNLTELYITHSNLNVLDLHDNFLDGVVSESHLSNLTSLKILFLGQNPLVFNVSPMWAPPFQLGWISISSCKIGPKFPQWLKTQTKLSRIDMSNASISDSIPRWFDNISLSIKGLDLSYNQIMKNLPRFRKLSGDLYSREIYLDSNKFDGPLAPFPSDIAVLDVSNNFLSGHIPQTLSDDGMPLMESLFLSNNQLSGSIPVYLCKMQDLNFLGLANNQLSGRLPGCWQKQQGLLVIDLANNNFSGPVPGSLGSLQQLVSLHLENNNLQGEIPLSLKNLANLRALDLSKNSLSSSVPAWIGGNLSSLRMLNLHSNMIHGEIPLQLCNLVSLRLLDLGRNKMTGPIPRAPIPRCFGSFTAMISNENKSNTWSQYGYVYTNYPHLAYDDHTLAYIKGTGLEYTKTLQFLFSIDLSGNNFTGKIPKELMSLTNLQNLNQSENNLEGHIPFNIGNMKLLESLDLSRNQLSGSIPPSISNLNFLSHLNLSFNNLSGHIPSGNQIQTLDDKSIYIGNYGLCGFPLKNCTEDDEPRKGYDKVENPTKDEAQKLWFFSGFGMGFTSGFVGVCGILYFKDSWRLAFFAFVDRVYNKLWVVIATKANQLQRKLQWKRV
uniref:Leucine-rich repeat-containing N-terminal plant-type domain-containing protein n=1 Tax=Manihot esculenta TaxID=3983 RepID=A0A2C9UFI9_MANES